MDSLTATKKLFHAIVVMGMAASLSACSSDTNPQPGNDAATGNDATTSNDAATSKDSSTPKDVAVADVAPPTDAGGDGFVGWLGC